MKPKVVVIVLLIAAGAAGYWYWQRQRAAAPLVLSGSIETRQVRVGSLVGGRVAAVHIEEGATVKAGDVLIEIDPGMLAPQVAEQKSKAEAAKATLDRTEAGPRSEDVARAKIAWQAAETDRKRFEALWRDGVIGRRDYDAALVAEATAKQTYLEKSRGSRSEDRAADTASLQAAQDRLSYLERQKDELVVRAPTDGVVQAFDLRPGDLVAANQAVASILERDQLWVRVYVPEPKLSAVHLGDAVEVAIDGTTKRFPGRITEIRDRAEYTPRNLQTQEQRMEQVFGVKVVVEPSPELKPGMAAFVHLRPAVTHG